MSRRGREGWILEVVPDSLLKRLLRKSAAHGALKRPPLTCHSGLFGALGRLFCVYKSLPHFAGGHISEHHCTLRVGRLLILVGDVELPISGARLYAVHSFIP